MSRSKWKGPYVNLNYLNNVNSHNKKKSILISRNSSVIPKFINKEFEVHTGNSYTKILITTEMIGHKFGEFVATRKTFIFKKKKKKKKKRR